MSQTHVDKLTQNITDLFISTAKSINLSKNPKPFKRSYARKHPNKPWFNFACEQKRKEYMGFVYKKGKKPRKVINVKYQEYKRFLFNRETDYKNEVANKLKKIETLRL